MATMMPLPLTRSGLCLPTWMAPCLSCYVSRLWPTLTVLLLAIPPSIPISNGTPSCAFYGSLANYFMKLLFFFAFICPFFKVYDFTTYVPRLMYAQQVLSCFMPSIGRSAPQGPAGSPPFSIMARVRPDPSKLRIAVVCAIPPISACNIPQVLVHREWHCIVPYRYLVYDSVFKVQWLKVQSYPRFKASCTFGAVYLSTIAPWDCYY